MSTNEHFYNGLKSKKKTLHQLLYNNDDNICLDKKGTQINGIS